MAPAPDSPEFAYTDLLPLLEDPYTTTTYRRLSGDGISTVDGPGAARFSRSTPRR